MAGRSGLAGAAPAGKRVLDVHGTGSGCELENCQRWVVFPLLINKRKTSSSPLEYAFALEQRHAADGEGKSCQRGRALQLGSSREVGALGEMPCRSS